jgi:hypothetical protein
MLNSQFDHTAEAERVLVWAKRATEVCSARRLNQLAERCAMFMDIEVIHRGDCGIEHLRAYRYWRDRP